MSRLISLEGGEGCGKSTQLAWLAGAFRRAGIPYDTTREPGGTEEAEAIRHLLFDDRYRWEPMAETLLFLAARMQHVRRRMAPALAEGTWVLCDRFADSTLVYQGTAGTIGKEYSRQLHTLLFGNFAPDLTLILDAPPEVALPRLKQRAGGTNRFDDAAIAFHRQIREGFLSLSKTEPARCVVIDASRSAAEVHHAILQAIHDRFTLALEPVETHADA